MLKTYEYRLYPTKEQEVLLAKHFGCVRLVYNKALALRNYYSGQGMPIGLVEPSSVEETMKREQNILKSFSNLEQSRI